jgi:hypothetical protein
MKLAYVTGGAAGKRGWPTWLLTVFELTLVLALLLTRD